MDWLFLQQYRATLLACWFMTFHLHFLKLGEEEPIFQQWMGTLVTGPLLNQFPLDSKPTGVSVLQLDSASLTQKNVVNAT